MTKVRDDLQVQDKREYSFEGSQISVHNWKMRWVVNIKYCVHRFFLQVLEVSVQNQSAHITVVKGINI